jgi:hypothetical protein
VFWWWRGGKEQFRQWPRVLRDVMMWHLTVVLLWFLLPKRLADVFYYLNPMLGHEHQESFRLLHGLPYYLHALQDDYLVVPGGLYLFAALLGLGFLAWPKLKEGSSGVFFVFLVSFCLTCQHSLTNNRFLHSWIALGGVIAAVGLIQFVQQLAGLLSYTLRPSAAAVACVVMVLLHGSAIRAPGHAQEGGIKWDRPPALTITDTYLPYLAGSKQPTVLCNVPLRFLTAWTLLEAQRNSKFTVVIKDFQAKLEHNDEQIRRWLATTSSDAVVLIEVRRDSPFFTSSPENVDLTTFAQVLDRQPLFVRAKRWELAEGVSIVLWKRTDT